MSLNIKNLAVICAAAALLGSVGGCAGRRVVPLESLTDPPKSEAYFVTTRQGEHLEFVTFRAEHDTLQGTVRTVVQRMTGQGGNERVEERNQYREVALPLADVERVEINRAGPSNLLLAAAGAAVVGGIYLIVNKPEKGPAGGGGDGGGKGGLAPGTLRGRDARSARATPGH